MHRFLLLPILLSVSPATAADPAGQPAPDKRWSLAYLLPLSERPVDVPPAAPVTEYPSTVHLPHRAPTDSPDVAVHPGANVTQTEISAVADPANPDIVFVSTNATNWPVTTVYGSGVYWSLDGGATWDGDDTGPGGVGNSGDPAAAIRRLDGRWIVGYISDGFGQGVSYTDDHGASWSHVNIFPGGTLDKNHLTVDNVPTSPDYGNVYAAWSALGSGPNTDDIELVRSTDGGASWSAVTNISNNVFSGSHDQGINLQVGPGGAVYACWAIYDSWPANETAIGFNSSTDGGVTWKGEFRAVQNILGHRQTPLPNTTTPRRNSFPSMAVDASTGPYSGNIYIVWTNQGMPGVNVGDVDIYLARSTDGGVTFGTPVRVNQDATTASQWFPWIACDPATGFLNVIYYDRRDDPSNVQARAYMSTSLDGGVTWEDVAVGDVAFTPTTIPGLATGYMGDYLGMTVSNGQAYPAWHDNRTGNFLCYVSPLTVADLQLPRPPTGVAAFSDFTTPSGMLLDWTDATEFTNGAPLTDFSVDILRDGAFVANVDQGIQTFTDGGLVDGQTYVYTLRTHEDVTDSLSVPVNVTWISGGSPVPSPPSDPGCASDSTSATVSWTNPSTQVDGTTLDDFAGVRIRRNGVFQIELARTPGDAGAPDSWIDHPPPGFMYTYSIAAIDNELPVHESAPLVTSPCFVGGTPPILIWQPADVVSPTADALLSATLALGESAARTDDLAFFSPNLNVHEIVFACVGVRPDNHVLTPAEGLKLDQFVQAGGRLYLEGGDCFNYDSDFGSSYNVRGIFGLADGPTIAATVTSVTGRNDLAAFSFSYAGGTDHVSELQPTTSSAVFRSNALDVMTVFKGAYGFGRSVGSSIEFGGLVTQAVGPRPIAGGTPLQLVEAYLEFFRSPGNPVLSVSADTLATTVYQDSLDTLAFTITNPGTPNNDLTYTIVETPDQPWLTVAPLGGTLGANGGATITAGFDATGMDPGSYGASLVVTSNDPVTPADTVLVTFDVLGAARLVLAVPEEILVPFDSNVTDSLSVTNDGGADLDYTLSLVGAGGTEREEQNSASNSITAPGSYRGNVYRIDTGLAITRIDQHLNLTSPTMLEFFVSEGNELFTYFHKTWSLPVAAGAGNAWYSTGPIDLLLEAGKSYLVGCSWQGTATQFSDDSQNMPQPVAFGEIIASAGFLGYPAPDSTLVTPLLTIWDQAVEFGFPLDFSFGSSSGTLAPGQTDVVSMNVGAGNTPGSWTAVVNVGHNTPGGPMTAVAPVALRVVDGSLVGSPLGGPALPLSFALHPASPNPARGSVVVRYDLPRASDVRLSIFDVTGRRVRLLKAGREDAGFRSIAWDGRDEGGSRVAAGVYFTSLQAGGEALRRKVVVLR